MSAEQARRTGPGVTTSRTAVMKDEERYRSGIVRYTLADRILHWWVALTFIYLLLSGFALGYPRMTWLYDVLGGGQTVRFLHPWIGVAFTVGIVIMLFKWVRDMLFDDVDREWRRRLRVYAKEGHVDLDVGKYNAGQKGYYWFAVVTGALLLVTGLPLWLPDTLSSGWNQWARLLHHVLFLLTVGGFIIHVYMSTTMFPGTFGAMTSGKVERRWAAFHHPRWFRKESGRA
ncbi:MAG: formate dehydrogenase subunit gamma [Actinomycetota bacterium]